MNHRELLIEAIANGNTTEIRRLMLTASTIGIIVTCDGKHYTANQEREIRELTEDENAQISDPIRVTCDLQTMTLIFI